MDALVRIGDQLDSSTNCHKLDDSTTPGVRVFVNPSTENAVGIQGERLLLHTGHGQLTRLIQGLGDDSEFRVAREV